MSVIDNVAAKGVKKSHQKIIDIMRYGMMHFDEIIKDDVVAASLIHGDYWLANFLVDKKTLNVKAIIDPMNSMFGDKDYDAFALESCCPTRYNLFNLYKEKTHSSDLLDLKCSFYALIYEMYWYTIVDTVSLKFVMGLVRKFKVQLKIHSI